MKVFFLILYLFVLAPGMVYAQSNQAPYFITEYDLFSPNFNAGKSYSSLYIPHRWEWSTEHNIVLKTLGLNLFVPSDRNGFDVGFSLCSEDMSIGSKHALQLTLSKKYELGANSFVVFGLGAGLENNTYHMSRLNNCKLLDFSKFSMENSFSTLSIGCMLFLSDYFAGSSTNYQVKKNIPNNITGLDYRFGRMFMFGNDISLRVMMIGRYYKYPQYRIDDRAIVNDFGELSHNLSLFCSFSNRFWLGAEIRFDREWGISMKKLVLDQLELGYEYDVKMNNGINRLNAHRLSVTYNY